MPRWPLRTRVRWWLAFLRLRGDRFTVEHNGIARIVAAVASLAIMVPIALTTRGAPAGLGGDTPNVQHAIADWIVYIIILIVAAILAVALAPKPVQPEAQKGKVPDAEDGKSIIRVYGTVWVEDPITLGFKTMGEDPIKKKGGKK